MIRRGCKPRLFQILTLLVAAAPLPVFGDEGPVSAGARLAAATLRVGAGYHVTAVASEPLLSNPVAFCFDPAGRIFVAETHRIKHGTEDNRDHMDWLDDDLACRTVEDRRAYLKRRMGDRIGWFTDESELVRLVEDRDKDGVYDHSSVFADGFRDIVDGAAAGVLWNGDRLLLTCIPSLWELRDADGNGKADEKRALATGFGVHCALFGHDLHGLCWGPDGRIYFSVGDRGFDVKTPQGELSNPDSGAVLRCRPDGSELEVFATGLRNPQELVFNELGDLFTVDNNSDLGDRARVVHIVEGMQAGWRMSYQYLSDRGPFMRERIWETQNEEQPATIVPPLDHLTDGPSGLTYYPGTGLPHDAQGAFFVCDFLGASGRSGVREFHLEQSGASYRLVRDSMFAQGVLATDCDFGPDGNLYISDWLEGWTGTGMGRIYRVESSDPQAAAERREVRELLGKMGAANADSLVGLLGHADMRVRLAAQRRLIAMGNASAGRLQVLASQGDGPQLARVHAVWALTALAEKDPGLFAQLAKLCNDKDAEIRNQAARALGAAARLDDAQRAAHGDILVRLLTDDAPRVASSAAISLGKLRYAPALAGLMKLARDNADRDPVLRHAAVMGLAGSQTPDALIAAVHAEGAEGVSEAERIAVVAALGRLRTCAVSQLLKDPSPRVVLEAARVIWDVPIPRAYGDLAQLVDDPRATSESLLRRALAASLADGSPERLAAVVHCGLRADVSPVVRELAWAAVSHWAQPSPRDPVHGQWRPVEERPKGRVLEELRTLWPTIADESAIDRTGVVVAAELGLGEAFGSLMEIIESESYPAPLRARAVEALSGADEAVVMHAIEAALDSPKTDVRLAGRRLFVRRFPDRAIEALRSAADSATIPERQEALQMLGRLDAPAAREAIEGWMSRVESGDCPPELVLEVLEAAAASREPALIAQQVDYKKQQAAAGPTTEFSMCLEGGDPVRGAEVFATNAALACKRCHSLKPDIVMVGPSLSDVGARRTRSEILESIVRPNQKIVEGFQTTSFLLDTGLAVSGLLRREDAAHAVLVDAENKELVVDLSTVEERSQGLSAMPDGLIQHMTLRELRNLVAYLATLKTPSKGDGTEAAAASDHGDAASPK